MVTPMLMWPDTVLEQHFPLRGTGCIFLNLVSLTMSLHLVLSSAASLAYFRTSALQVFFYRLRSLLSLR